MLDPEYHDIVKEALDKEKVSMMELGPIRGKLEWCRRKLASWSRSKFAHGERTIKELIARLEMLQRQEAPHNRAENREIQGQLERIHEQEDLRWKQRAKQTWYQKGDRNTPYFHAWASQRQRKDRIDSILDENGSVWSNPEDVQKAFKQFYQ